MKDIMKASDEESCQLISRDFKWVMLVIKSHNLRARDNIWTRGQKTDLGLQRSTLQMILEKSSCSEMSKTGFLSEGFIQRGSTPTLQEVGSNELKLTLDSWEQLTTAEGRRSITEQHYKSLSGY